MKTEAPISKALLCKRVLNSFAIARMGTRLAAHMDLLLERSQFKTTGKEVLFYWNEIQNPQLYNTYRPDSKREALDIAPEEIAAAVCHILEEQGALSEEDLLREVARRFNYMRMGDNVVVSMSRGISYAVKSGRALKNEGKVKANDLSAE